MTRQKITSEVEKDFGMMPAFMAEMPDQVLAQYWTNLKWVLSDTELSSREKALIAFGAATAAHCPY
jgi:alkylhydroperoxidase/carboxymuconolactone decarboxylase family protein YurZ